MTDRQTGESDPNSNDPAAPPGEMSEGCPLPYLEAELRLRCSEFPDDYLNIQVEDEGDTGLMVRDGSELASIVLNPRALRKLHDWIGRRIAHIPGPCTSTARSGFIIYHCGLVDGHDGDHLHRGGEDFTWPNEETS